MSAKRGKSKPRAWYQICITGRRGEDKLILAVRLAGSTESSNRVKLFENLMVENQVDAVRA